MLFRSPPPLRSGHLEIKDAQCAENNDGRKISYHIIPRLSGDGVWWKVAMNEKSDWEKYKYFWYVKNEETGDVEEFDTET